MKQCIVGSHGVGKSTIIDAIDHPNKIKEIARELIEYIGKAPQEMNKDELEYFQEMIYRTQVLRENESFLSDRGVYDNLAYSYFASKKLFYNLLDETFNYHHGYDKVYYIPIEFDLIGDGIRFEDLEFQKEVDDKICEILDLFNVESIRMEGSIEDRLLVYNKNNVKK